MVETEEDLFTAHASHAAPWTKQCECPSSSSDMHAATGGPSTSPVFGVLRDMHGKVQCSLNGVVRNVADGNEPAVLWEVREIFYHLPWSSESDSLSRYLRRANVRTELKELEDFFEIDAAVHFHRSQKQKSASPAEDHAGDEGVDHEVEIMASTAWTVLLLLSFLAPTKKRRFRAAAARQLDAFAEVASRGAPVIKAMGEELPSCDHCAGGHPARCKHVKGVAKALQKQCGQKWGDFRKFMETSIKQRFKCDAVNTWRFQAFWQLAEGIDIAVLAGALGDGPAGQPVLQGPKRCRRLTRTWLTTSGMQVNKTPKGAQLAKSQIRDTSNCYTRDRVVMEKYHGLICDTFGGSTLMSVALDGSDKSGKDIASMAACTLEPKEANAWLPIQDGCLQTN